MTTFTITKINKNASKEIHSLLYYYIYNTYRLVRASRERGVPDDYFFNVENVLGLRVENHEIK
jgi:hypothetical protein